MTKNSINLKTGDNCVFYDAGKMSESRTYSAKVVRIVTKEEAKHIMFEKHIIPDTDKPVSLFEIWQNISQTGYLHDIYSNDTDSFVECTIPAYDGSTIWFARSSDGGWWSMDIQSSWQHGKLVSKTELVISKFNEACNSLAKQFVKVVYNDETEFFWIANRIGDLCCFSNMVALTPEEMVFILENNITTKEISEWWDNMSVSEEKQFINLHSWHLGLRPEMIEKQS